MRSYTSSDSAVKHLRPEQAVVIYRPHALKRAVDLFASRFRGAVLYAVKTNPDEHVLKDLWAHGVRKFDVASLHEVAMVRGLFPEAELYFMHTVKSRHAIREAYFTYGVRHFSLDSEEELAKILVETKYAEDLGLHVRIAIPNTYAELALTDKFGATLDAAPRLLERVRAVAAHAGVCFHVGSQCMHPDAYKLAIKLARQVVKQSGVRIDSLDVGGGFPSIYPGMTPPDLGSYFAAIHDAARDLVKAHGCALMCEPGRALVAESGSVVVRVDARKGDFLYLNDGTYGSLFDAGTPKFIFPARLLGRRGAEAEKGFSFYGPTCDTLDFMKGPFMLPADVQEGDYLEIGQLGAYGRTMATRFNGFSLAHQPVLVRDEPLMSLYAQPQVERRIAVAARG
ncbi:MAG: type III PLP-dependent enzyme [Alphaproteobacteria bacterium]|nr:type III PLP-dependent enzyme [Alphaproteobacteria bacterium]